MEGTGKHLCDLRSNNALPCKRIFSLTVEFSNFKFCRCMGHMVCRVLGNILCNLDPKVKVKGKKAGICDCVPSTAALVLS